MPPHTDSAADKISQRRVAIASAVGLHARPASLFVSAARQTGLAITVTGPTGRIANAASILEVLSLGVACGQFVTLTASGEGADAALESLCTLLSTDFDTP
jgi:phosphocarrier protein HPr